MSYIIYKNQILKKALECQYAQCSHKQDFESICADKNCKHFFKPACGVCLKDHTHNGAAMKTLNRTLTNLTSNLFQIQENIDYKENHNKDIEMFFTNLILKFQKLTDNIDDIAKNILSVQNWLTQKVHKQNITTMLSFMNNIFTTPTALIPTLEEIYKFIKFDEKNSLSPLQWSSDINNTMFNNIQSAEMYFNKMNTFLTDMTTYLEFVQQQSLIYEPLVINWKLTKSQVHQSQDIEESVPGLVFSGTQGGQVIVSDEAWETGRHEMFFQIEKINFGQYRMLSVGIIQDDGHEKNFPIELMGCNKCLFRENSQDQMIQVGENFPENSSFEDILVEGSIIKATLDLDNQWFEIQPVKSRRKYVTKLTVFSMKNKKFRFVIMWSTSHHQIKLLGSK